MATNRVSKAEEKVYCDECLDKDIESEMVMREGKWGEFYGCSRYPKCLFSLNERQYENLKLEQSLY